MVRNCFSCSFAAHNHLGIHVFTLLHSHSLKQSEHNGRKKATICKSDQHNKSSQYIYNTSTIHLQYIYNTSTIHLQYIYNTSTIHLQYIYNTSTIHLQDFYKTSTIHLQYIYKTSTSSTHLLLLHLLSLTTKFSFSFLTFFHTPP